MKGLFASVNDAGERASFLPKFPFNESGEEETDDSEDSDESGMLPKDPIYHEQGTGFVFSEIMKIVAPSTISAVVCQSTFLLGYKETAETITVKQLAGLGLGYAITHLFGILILLGLNTALQTKISHAYGQMKLTLCQTYVFRAHFLIIMLFTPIVFLLVSSESILLGIG